MKQISQSIHEVTDALSPTDESLGKMMRANHVRELWKDAIIKIYGTNAGFILSSINAVYILNEKGLKTLIVYSSDSLVRDSLSNMREFIVHELAAKGEQIEEFRVVASRLGMRERRPFNTEFIPEIERLEEEKHRKRIRNMKLSEHQLEQIEETCRIIEDKEIRESFQKAMTACFKSQNN